MNINYLIAITGLITSSIAAFAGWRFYTRFGQGTYQWGWLLVTIGAISLAISEFFDAYATFQNGELARFSDFFAILAEILLTVGFVRMFRRELVEEKLHQKKLESSLAKSQGLLSTAIEMTASLNLEETLEVLLQRAIMLTGADLAAIYLTEQNGKPPGRYFAVRRGSGQIVIHEREWAPLTWQVLATGSPILIENPEDHKVKQLSLPQKLTALGALPLREMGESLGILFVGFNEAHAFEDDQQVLLTSLADHGALALRNAALYQQVEELSRTDPLTGLANRRQFEQMLAKELIRARRYDDPLSLVILDVDHFKSINDSWGHIAGDAALKHIARILKTNLRLVDLAARIGGDEIVLLLPDTEIEQAVQLAERLREQIKQPSFVWNANSIPLSCSFGVSGSKGKLPAENAERLYELTDLALYNAKEQGRDRVSMAIQQEDFENLHSHKPKGDERTNLPGR